MRRIFAMMGCGIVFAGWAAAQTAPAAFDPDTADVHVTPSGGKQDMAVLPRAGIELRGQTMINLITFAYSVDEKNVIGGPPWLVTDRFDVIAKAPEAATFPELQKVLQTVLESRFHLVTHKDERAFPVFYLSAGKKPALKENKNEGIGDCKLNVQNGLAPIVALT